MQLDENLLAVELKVDETTTMHLRETGKWARFLGVTGMVLSIAIALMGIFAGFFLSTLSRRYQPEPYYGSGSASMIGGGAISLFYILIAGLCFLISIFLYYFGSKMTKALKFTDQGLFNESLLNLKRYYRITGIITIIYLSFVLLALLFVLLAAVFTSSWR